MKISKKNKNGKSGAVACPCTYSDVRRSEYVFGSPSTLLLNGIKK